MPRRLCAFHVWVEYLCTDECLLICNWIFKNVLLSSLLEPLFSQYVGHAVMQEETWTACKYHGLWATWVKFFKSISSQQFLDFSWYTDESGKTWYLPFLMSFGQPLSQPDTQLCYKAWLSHAKLPQCTYPTSIAIPSFYLALVVTWYSFLHIGVPHTPSCFHPEHWLDFFAHDLAMLAIVWASVKCLPTVFHSQLGNVCTTMNFVKTI